MCLVKRRSSLISGFELNFKGWPGCLFLTRDLPGDLDSSNQYFTFMFCIRIKNLSKFYIHREYFCDCSGFSISANQSKPQGHSWYMIYAD